MSNCPDKYRYMLVKLGLKSGSTCRALSSRRPDFARQLINSVPDGSTLAERLIVIAEEKYNEERTA